MARRQFQIMLEFSHPLESNLPTADEVFSALEHSTAREALSTATDCDVKAWLATPEFDDDDEREEVLARHEAHNASVESDSADASDRLLATPPDDDGFPQSDCPECDRSFGPNHKGPCPH